MMKMAQVRAVNSEGDVIRFDEAVAAGLSGQARRKGDGCRTGHYLVREDAVEAFSRLAARFGLDVFYYDPASLERPGRAPVAR